MVNDILTGIPVAEGVIPDSVATFSEASAYVIESVENDFNCVMEECGFVAEDGTLNESVALTEGFVETKEKLVDTLNRLWSSIKAWFEKVIKWFKDKADRAKEFLAEVKARVEDEVEYRRKRGNIKKFEGLNKASLDTIDPKTKFGKVHDFNDVPGGFDALSNKAQVGISDAVDKAEDAAAAREAIRAILNKSPMSKLKDDMRDKIIVPNSYKEWGKADVIAKFDEMYKVVIDNSTAKAIKVAYNEARKAIKEAIQLAKKDIKASKKDKDSENAAKLAAKVGGLKRVNQMLHALHGVAMDCYRQRYNEYMKVLSIAVRAVTRAEKKAGKKSANEADDFAAMFDF